MDGLPPPTPTHRDQHTPVIIAQRILNRALKIRRFREPSENSKEQRWVTVRRLPHHPSSENLMLESPPKVPAGTFSVPTVPVEHRSRDRIGPNTYRRPTPPHLRWPDCTFSPIHGLSGPRAPINHRRDPAVTQSLAIPPVVGPWQAYTRSYRRPSDRVPPAGQALRNTQPMHHCTDPCA